MVRLETFFSRLKRCWWRYWQSFVFFAVLLLTVNLSPATSLPELQIHPLPQSLVQWQTHATDNYFEQIKTTTVGYLIWSEFPIKVYLDKTKISQDNSASNLRLKQWLEIVEKAVATWNKYLPIAQVENLEIADIIIKPEKPPLETKYNPETKRREIIRAATAQTRYQFYWQSSPTKILAHRMTIIIDPGQNNKTILSAARHELGHALGIWGHSEAKTDIMYFSALSYPADVSARDVNTLKKIYQQPTRLGWGLPHN